MSLSSNLATEERLSWIRSKLNADGSVKIGPVADELGVSEMTIRRDLQELEGLGVARRVRGGAVAVGPVPFAERHRSQAKAKSRIAMKLLPLLPQSGAIGIDASSTLLRLATTVESGRDLTVLTNGIETFHALQGKPGVTSMLTGGELDNRTGSLVGPIATRSAGNFLLQKLFVSANSISVGVGTSEAVLEEADVKRAMAAVSAEVVVAIDSSKLDTRAVAVAIEWEQVTTLVTELDPRDKRLRAYRDHARVL